MSRVGRMPIDKPSGVSVTIEPTRIEVKGPKGTLDGPLTHFVNVQEQDSVITVERVAETRRHRAMHGLTRALVANMVLGVTEGFTKHLLVVGTGYRAQMQGKSLQVQVGFSHPVNFDVPDGVTVEVGTPEQVREGNQTVQRIPITVTGIDKQFVGETAAAIRRIKKPETYEPSKGIRYADEKVRNMAKKARV